MTVHLKSHPSLYCQKFLCILMHQELIETVKPRTQNNLSTPTTETRTATTKLHSPQCHLFQCIIISIS